MVHKRPFEAEQVFDVSFKHQKEVGPSNQLVSFPKSVYPEDVGRLTTISDEGARRQAITEDSVKHHNDIFEIRSGDCETNTSGSIHVSSWAPSSNNEDLQSESPVHFPITSHYLSPRHSLRTLVRHENIYSLLLENPPRKLVCVGANYQADIPTCDFSGASSRLDSSDAQSNPNLIDDKEQGRLMGTCIIPMPHVESSTFDNDNVGKGRTDCSCEDSGSVRCVRLHIVEAREELIKSIGLEGFIELGFPYMGEQVAEKWSAEDEQLFHEFVYNNPSSLGKNFWNNISFVFPSRTKMELVSYYYNVFMLRRQAEQNRNELLNIDSDNDEWQGSDDGNEVATQEEEDMDSVVDSLVYQGVTRLTGCQGNELEDYAEYSTEETPDGNEILDFAVRDIDDDLKYDLAEIPRSSGSLAPIQTQHGSSTACDRGVASREAKTLGIGDHRAGNQNDLSNGCSHGYPLEPCDAKVWDSGIL